MALIHIGLHKTGSSALQEVWSRTDRVVLNWQNLTPLIEEIKQKVNTNNVSSMNYDVHQIKTLPDDDSTVPVYSSEALSTYAYGLQCTRQQVTLSR